MTEVRLKLRTLVLGAVLLVALVYLIFRGKDCNSGLISRLQPEHPITIYAITPTYARPVQRAELTRLAQTLMLVPNVHWVIVEDADYNSPLVKLVIARTNLTMRTTLIHAKTPDKFKRKQNVSLINDLIKDKIILKKYLQEPNWKKARGVDQRNAGLEVVRNLLLQHPKSRGIVYFMDDDNTYSKELFLEMEKIKHGKVGVWPVGLVGGLMVEKPVLDDDKEIIGFNSAWEPERPFPIDMASFAISGDLLLSYPEAVFSFDVNRGYQESEILRHLTVVRDMQPLANKCTEVLVWHTRTEEPKLTAELALKKEGQRSDSGMIV